MYAVIQTGGKQYKVAPGDVLRVEKLNGEVGDQITFEAVLFVGAETQFQVGVPLVQGASVTGTILDHLRGSKIVVLKFKRRKMYRRKSGHRQSLTAIRIDEIKASQAPEATASKKAAPKKAARTKSTPNKATTKKSTSGEDPEKLPGKGAVGKKPPPLKKKATAPRRAKGLEEKQDEVAARTGTSVDKPPREAGSPGETDSGSDQSTKSKE